MRQKLNAISPEFQAKNVLLVEDSIVRGTTTGQIVRQARRAGANKVFMPASPHHRAGVHLLRVRQEPLATLGVAAIAATSGDRQALFAAIDREFYTRSRAHYEASFKAPT